MKKEIVFEDHALEEFMELDKDAKEEFTALLEKLQDEGILKEPEAKKLGKNLLELRIRIESNQWRGLYAYYLKDKIVILRFFQKKTQKTPKKEVDLALKRFKKL